MITKKTEYAIRALSELASDPGRRMTANQVAQRQEIPPKYLPQIVSELSQAGLLHSVRGYGGGIRLGRPAHEITLMQVIEAVQGPPILVDCQFGAGECPLKEDCNIRAIYDRALRAMRKELENARLSEVRTRRPVAD
jgi:Rrf2 family protein